MIIPAPDDIYRDILARPFRFWIGDLPQEDSDQRTRDILDVFYSWQERQADKHGKVAVVNRVELPLTTLS